MSNFGCVSVKMCKFVLSCVELCKCNLFMVICVQIYVNLWQLSISWQPCKNNRILKKTSLYDHLGSHYVNTYYNNYNHCLSFYILKW